MTKEIKDVEKRSVCFHRTLEDVHEWFNEQRYHAVPGDQIDTLSDWNKLTKFDQDGGVMVCYLEADDTAEAEPYVFDGIEYRAVYADPIEVQVVALTENGKETGYYAVMCDGRIAYV